MSTKANPGPFDCYEEAEDDEPMFVLLARDESAPVLVRLWAELRALGGGELVKVEEAREVAEQMENWRLQHRSSS